MKEIRGARTEGSKRFIKDDKSALVTRAHSGKIHYLNKLGVGDSKGDLRSIDLTLIPCEDGWRSEYNACHLHIPALADDVATFRDVYGAKDQTTSIQADCKPVKGELIPDGIEGLTTANCVVYLDAFQDGTDLIYVPFTTGLKKIVRIREKKAWKNDKKFTFFLQLPDESEIYRISDKDEYKLNPKKKVLDSPRGSAIRTKDGDTTIRPFMAWSDDECIDIKVEYAPDDGDGWSTFTKIVSAEFIAAATGEVFADATVDYDSTSFTQNFYSNSSSSWSTIRGATTSTDYNSSDASPYLNCHTNGSRFWWGRMAFRYDTTGIGSDIISSVAAVLTVKAIGAENRGTNSKFVYCEYTGLSYTASQYNWNDYGSTEFGRTAHVSGTGSKSATFNAAGIAAIDGTGYTDLGIKAAYDFDNSPCTTASEMSVEIYSYGAGLSDPYLTITHAPAPAAGAVTGALMVQSF